MAAAERLIAEDDAAAMASSCSRWLAALRAGGYQARAAAAVVPAVQLVGAAPVRGQ